MKKLLLLITILFITSFANENQSGYVESSEAKIYYEVIGDGEPLVLLHGGLGPGNHFQHNMPEFKKHYQLIIVHTRGHGKSSDNGTPFSYSTFADDLNEVLEYLQIKSANIIGFSDGGVTGYQFASKYPEKVKKLIVVGGNFKVDGMTKSTIDWIKNSLSPEFVSENMPGIKENFISLNPNPNPNNFDNYINKTREMWLRDPYVEIEKFKKINVPILILAGDNDGITLEHLIEMHQLLKNSQLGIIPNATHFVLSERPEIVNRICLEFFQRK